jgi:tetrahydrodipicolinate N-succinyltransferase
LKQVLNTYQIGDLVLVDVRNSKPTKLSPNFLGPYSVQEVFKADVTIKHLVTEDVRVVHMEKMRRRTRLRSSTMVSTWSIGSLAGQAIRRRDPTCRI